MDEDRSIRREVLPNGLTLITEEMKHIRSVCIGIWIKTGSRDEDVQWNGISHFVEHMVFKGTQHRSAEEIAREVDSIGGNIDAFTAKECVSFSMKVLDEHLPIALDVLSDLVLNPVFDIQDISRERGVILEEIKMAPWPTDSGNERHRQAIRESTGVRFLQPAFHTGKCDHHRRWIFES